jgi:hypothetical protein
MKRTLEIIFIFLISITPLFADQPLDFLGVFEAQAKSENPAFSRFSVNNGEQFFKTQHGGDWSCSSCHTINPSEIGKHVVTQKAIQPLAPIANSERFTDSAKVDKWFKRNCKDVVNRECTAQEKGDVLTYLLSLDKSLRPLP